MRTGKALRSVLGASVAAGIFLALGWPALVSDDPSGAGLELAAKAAAVAFFGALAALLTAKARRGGR